MFEGQGQSCPRKEKYSGDAPGHLTVGRAVRVDSRSGVVRHVNAFFLGRAQFLRGNGAINHHYLMSSSHPQKELMSPVPLRRTELNSHLLFQ